MKQAAVAGSHTGERNYDFSHWRSLPFVSCQCITYGRTHLLDEAVESFIRQDYAGPKELVILNDLPGLTIQFDHPEVRVINLPKRMATIGEKRNLCVDSCRGEIIYVWDDDDISLPHRISYTLQQMKNLHYFKSDRLWDWRFGVVAAKPVHALGHAMSAWSKSLFEKSGKYPPIQSGQDWGLEKRFRGPLRVVEQTPDDDLFYIYRFKGTGSYHLSYQGYRKGYQEAGEFVTQRPLSGTYVIRPKWRQNYSDLINAVLSGSQP